MDSSEVRPLSCSLWCAANFYQEYIPAFYYFFSRLALSPGQQLHFDKIIFQYLVVFQQIYKRSLL